MTMASEGARSAGIEPPLRELRFWLIQGVVAAVTLFHGAVEWIERNGELTGFFDGLHQLPVSLYIVPILLAGFWYGLRGGVMTGLVTLALSVPNLFFFHSEDYAWFGEALTNLVVVGVGVVVALLVERNDRLRLEAESHSRRMHTLWQVAGSFGRCQNQESLVGDVVGALVTSGAVEGAGFAPHDAAGVNGLLVRGSDAAVERIAGAATQIANDEKSNLRQRLDDLLLFDVTTAQRSYGTLILVCPTDMVCSGDSAVYSLVAAEMAAVLENLGHRDQERSRLQSYTRAVTDAQERERRRIARELHDGPAQSMILLKRGLRGLAHGTGQAEGADATRDLQDLVQTTLLSIQRTMFALRPLVLDDLGLVPALRSLVNGHLKRGHLALTMKVVGEERRLDLDAELAAYRIAQESLTNIERHAGAESASVLLEFAGDALTMTISDRGCGFEVDYDDGLEHLGIAGMYERAELARGELRIDSSPDEGTTVRLAIPG